MHHMWNKPKAIHFFCRFTRNTCDVGYLFITTPIRYGRMNGADIVISHVILYPFECAANMPVGDGMVLEEIMLNSIVYFVLSELSLYNYIGIQAA